MTIIGVVIFSGRFFTWPRLEQIVATLVLVGLGWLITHLRDGVEVLRAAGAGHGDDVGLKPDFFFAWFLVGRASPRPGSTNFYKSALIC